MSKPTALISGVGRRAGIGAGIARMLAAEGWDLALTYWTPYDERMPWGVQPNDIAQLRDELVAMGARVVPVSADLEQVGSAAEIFKTATTELGAVSALVLSHCESVSSGILDTTLESFERHFDVNARASWQLIREFAGQVPTTGGRIVALTSDHTVGNLPYGASKGAMDRIVLAAARELAHLKITSNLINPGPVDTGWMDEETRNLLAGNDRRRSRGSCVPPVFVWILDQWPAHKIRWGILGLTCRSNQRLSGKAISVRETGWHRGLSAFHPDVPQKSGQGMNVCRAKPLSRAKRDSAKLS